MWRLPPCNSTPPHLKWHSPDMGSLSQWQLDQCLSREQLTFFQWQRLSTCFRDRAVQISSHLAPPPTSEPACFKATGLSQSSSSVNIFKQLDSALAHWTCLKEPSATFLLYVQWKEKPTLASRRVFLDTKHILFIARQANSVVKIRCGHKLLLVLFLARKRPRSGASFFWLLKMPKSSPAHFGA